MKRRHILAAALAAAFATLVHAQGTYPTKPIRLVVPFATGGTSEIVARAVAQQLSAQLGQSVVVENKAGGAGTIAMSEVAKSAPDGYTLILGHVGTLAVNPYAMASQPYDVNRDFVPVALLARVPNLFVLSAQVPGQGLQGVHRAREEGAGQAQLRLRRQRQRRASRVRVPEARHRHRRRARTVQGHRAAAAGSARRAPRRIVGGPARADAAHQERQARRVRRRDAAAHPRAAGRADRRRDGLQGLRDVAVVRDHRAEGHAARRRREAERRDQQGAGLQRRHAALRRGQRRRRVSAVRRTSPPSSRRSRRAGRKSWSGARSGSNSRAGSAPAGAARARETRQARSATSASRVAAPTAGISAR